MARLPQPGGDAGNWGAILNDYLSQAHAADGSLRPDIVTASNIADGAIASSHLSGAIQSSLTKAESAYQKPAAGVPLADLSRADLDEAYAPTDYVLKQLARTPDALIAGAVARNSDGVVTSAPVIWPDGTSGVYTTTAIDLTGAVNGYTITYGSPVTKTFTQPTITRDSSGAVTNVPAVVGS